MDPHKPRTSWFGRNWFWVVPVGCLGLCSLPFVLVAGLFGLVFGTLTGSQPYRDALERARVHPEVIQELGEPIEAGWSVTGTISMSPPTPEMDITVPLKGPDRSGRLFVSARKIEGEWVYERLEVRVSGRRIDLLGSEEELEPEEKEPPGIPV